MKLIFIHSFILWTNQNHSCLALEIAIVKAKKNKNQ